jgi:quinol monooxygenase YgiN
MYGTILRCRPKPGQIETILTSSQRWVRERGMATGFLGQYLLKPDRDPGEWIGLVIFDSEESYRRNAADPEQDRWYRELRSMLEADPEWTDGEIVALEPASVPL